MPAEMLKVVLAIAAVSSVAALAGCSGALGDSSKYDEAEVRVRVNGTPTACEILRHQEARGHVVPCPTLAEYFRDELHLPPNAKYYFVDGGSSRQEEIAGLVSRMKAVGFPPIGVMSVSFLSDPEPIS